MTVLEGCECPHAPRDYAVSGGGSLDDAAGRALGELYDALMQARDYVAEAAELYRKARMPQAASVAADTLERVDGALANAADYRVGGRT